MRPSRARQRSASRGRRRQPPRRADPPRSFWRRLRRGGSRWAQRGPRRADLRRAARARERSAAGAGLTGAPLRGRYFGHRPPPAGSHSHRTERFAAQRLPRSRCAEGSDSAPRRRTAGRVTARSPRRAGARRAARLRVVASARERLLLLVKNALVFIKPEADFFSLRGGFRQKKSPAY